MMIPFARKFLYTYEIKFYNISRKFVGKLRTAILNTVFRLPALLYGIQRDAIKMIFTNLIGIYINQILKRQIV